MKRITFLITILALLVTHAVYAQCDFGLKSSSEAGAKQITYTINLPHMPNWQVYYGYDFNIVEGKWPAIDAVDSDGDGVYEATITRYDGPVHMYWGNRKKERRNVFLEQHPWYDKAMGCLSFVVMGGGLYPPGTEVPIRYGKFGDKYFRVDDQGDKIDLFVCYASFNEEIERPFIQHSADDGAKWDEEPMEMLGSDGWAKITIDKYDILVASVDDNSKLQIRFGFGAYSKKSGKKIYLDPKNVKSDYVNSQKDGYTIPLEKCDCKNQKKY